MKHLLSDRFIGSSFLSIFSVTKRLSSRQQISTIVLPLSGLFWIDSINVPYACRPNASRHDILWMPGQSRFGTRNFGAVVTSAPSSRVRHLMLTSGSRSVQILTSARQVSLGFQIKIFKMCAEVHSYRTSFTRFKLKF